jgi:succinoglycan biosynthesis protein ExoA
VDTLPTVSVVIPARDEERYIASCLESVLAQDYPADLLEILVVDGRSRDGTRAIVEELAHAHPRLRLLDNPRRLIPHALNVGIRAARGSIIVRVDGHSVIDSDYVSRCVHTLQASGAHNVGGPMRSKGLGFWGRVNARAMSSPFGRPGKFNHATKPQDVDTVFLGTFQRETLERVGLFDESFPKNEDYELNFRIRSAGGRVHYDPTIRWDYYNRESLPALWLQYWNYGRGKALVIKRHPRSVRPRHLVAPAFVLALAGGLGLAAFGRPKPLLALLGIYVTSSGFFAWRAAGDGGILVVGAVALAFASMHLSWGISLVVELLSGRPCRAAADPRPLPPPFR